LTIKLVSLKIACLPLKVKNLLFLIKYPANKNLDGFKIMKLLLKIKKFFSKKKIKKYYGRSVKFINQRPILSFVGVLILLLLIIFLGTLISAPKKTEETKPLAKSVQVYKIGVAPRVTVQAKIEKSGVVKIVALAGGVVESINVNEGDEVFQGANLVTLVSNYAGGNAFALQAQIAQAQYKNVLDTFDGQNDLIKKQRDLANSVETNADKLREISEQSISETQNLINLDQDILNTLDQNLGDLEESNTSGQNDALILQTKQMKSQFLTALNGLNQMLRNTQYQASDTNPPADIARQQKDIALKQLDIQEKSLALNKEISRLQAVLAEVNSALMHPTAPFAGRVERIYARNGQAVSPGTPLLLLSGSKGNVEAVAMVSENLAKNVSRLESSTLYFGNNSYGELPFYISNEATDNQLFTIQFSIPDNFKNRVTDGGYISVSIPIGYPNTSQTIPYVPLDAIYQSQEQAYLYVAEKGKAVSKTVKLGQVYGRFVEIKSGLVGGDQVILNRNIIAGDLVSPAY